MDIILYMLMLDCLYIYFNGMVCVWRGLCGVDWSVSEIEPLLNSAVEHTVDDDDVTGPKGNPLKPKRHKHHP